MTAHLEHFTAKRDHCRGLLDLSRQQAALIADDDYTGLLEILARKQALLAKIETQNARHADSLRRWRTERDLLPAQTRSACESILAETEELVSQLVNEEQSSIDSVTARRDETRTEIATLTTGTAVNDAYGDCLAPSTSRTINIET